VTWWELQPPGTFPAPVALCLSLAAGGGLPLDLPRRRPQLRPRPSPVSAAPSVPLTGVRSSVRASHRRPQLRPRLHLRSLLSPPASESPSSTLGGRTREASSIKMSHQSHHFASSEGQQSALTIRHQQAAVTGKWPNHHDNDSLQT